jgi:hypothetical protein
MFAPLFPITGQQPFNDWFTPDTTQRMVLGNRVLAVDPFWGFGEFLYVLSADAILKGSLVMWDENHSAALLPSTTLQGFPFGVAMAPMANGVYGWLQIAGTTVYKTNATVAADVSVAVAAAGIAGTLATGKQLVGVRNRRSATATKTVTAGTQTGNGILTTTGYDGFFLGMALSGTGIPASTVVAALSSDGRTIYTGSAIGTLGDKNSTATGSITLTGTYTGYGAGVLNHPFAQGAIT